MNEPAPKKVRVTSKRVSGKPKSVSQYTLVMHEAKLRLCLAAGVISPWPRGLEIVDQHVNSSRLVIEETEIPSRKFLQDATGGLTYGQALVVELRPDFVRSQPGFPDKVIALPLAAVKRVVFPTRAAKDEFLARSAGFSDITQGLVDLAVAESAFAQKLAEASGHQLPLHEESNSDSEPADTPPAVEPFRLLTDQYDRQAGSIAATARACESVKLSALINDLGCALGSLVRGSSIQPFPAVLAAQVDTKAVEQGALKVLDAVLVRISEIPFGDGINAEKLLSRVQADLGTQSDGGPPVVSRFLSHAMQIIRAERDFPANGFSDVDGSVTLRSILLFLLNPEADRLDAILKRMQGVGPRVYCLAASLMGYRSGFASLSGEIKGGIAKTKAIPWLVLDAVSGTAAAPTMIKRWDVNSGDCRDEVSWQGIEIASATTPMDMVIRRVANLAPAIGATASFNPESGVLALQRVGDDSSLTCLVDIAEEPPIFPRVQGLRLRVEASVARTRKAQTALVQATNLISERSGIFAAEVPTARKSQVWLAAYLTLPLSATALDQAFTALASSNKAANPTVVVPPENTSEKIEQQADT